MKTTVTCDCGSQVAVSTFDKKRSRPCITCGKICLIPLSIDLRDDFLKDTSLELVIETNPTLERLKLIGRGLFGTLGGAGFAYVFWAGNEKAVSPATVVFGVIAVVSAIVLVVDIIRMKPATALEALFLREHSLAFLGARVVASGTTSSDEPHELELVTIPYASISDVVLHSNLGTEVLKTPASSRYIVAHTSCEAPEKFLTVSFVEPDGSTASFQVDDSLCTPLKWIADMIMERTNQSRSVHG